ncbi:MAG: hypothetical protein VX095_00760 [Pseudomonadota bacterium]|nr:hypothetical protein [Pseudomonadota bacterium]
MSDFTFSASLGAPPQSLPTGRLWSFNGVRTLAGPARSVILHKVRGDRRMLVQPDVAEALTLCNRFRTLEAHTRTIFEAMPALREHAEHTLQILQNLANAGLFESSEACWERVTTPEPTPEPQSPCQIFILTCDRPAALNRVLSGLREFPLPDVVEGVLIIDDSRRAENIQENRAIINVQLDNATVPVVHVDPGVRKDLIQHLTTSLPNYQESIEWLLERSVWGTAPTYGIARNLALLLSVGKRALVLDDDIIPQAVAPPLSSSSLRFGTANEREAIFYKSRESLTQGALPLPESPLTMMLTSLGEPLASLLTRQLPGQESLSGFDGEILNRHHGGSRALLTQCGSWGDPGTSEGNWIFNLPKASIKKVLGEDTALETFLGARSHWMGYRGPVLSQYGTLSQLTGIDHTSLLPPYLPAGRGEDVLFGIMVQRLHPESTVWNEGWAIRHEPQEERRERGELTPLSVKPGLSMLTDWLGREPRDQWGLSPGQRLTGLAEGVRRLAYMETGAIETLIQQELVSKRGALLSRCVNLLSDVKEMSELPGAADWRGFLEASRDQLVRELQTPEPNPLNVSGDAKERKEALNAETLCNHGESFAKTLDAWPQLCASAATFTT